MKKNSWVLFVTTLVLVFSASAVYSETAKEGSYTGKNYATGTSKALPMGEERIHVTFEGTGKYASITGGGEYTRSNLQPASKGVWAAITLFTGNWKLP